MLFAWENGCSHETYLLKDLMGNRYFQNTEDMLQSETLYLFRGQLPGGPIYVPGRFGKVLAVGQSVALVLVCR